MIKYPVGSLVKHKKDDHLVFRVVEEWFSVPEGGPSLYECVRLDAETYKYHEDDLYAYELSEDEAEKCYR